MKSLKNKFRHYYQGECYEKRKEITNKVVNYPNFYEPLEVTFDILRTVRGEISQYLRMVRDHHHNL